MEKRLSLPLLEGPEGGDDAAAIKVGDLAQRTGKTVRAIHLFEEMGLLLPAARSPGGFRLYREDAVKRVEWIAKLQAMGFTLHEVRSFLRSYEESPSAPEAMARVREIFAGKLAETQEHVERLAGLVADLRASLAYLESCHQCGVPQLPACHGCELHGHGGRAPELVEELHAHRERRL